MIIVSQSKEIIVNFENITFIEVDTTNNSITFYSNGTRGRLGQYKNYERAKEVLQNIIEAYAPRNPQSLAELANYRQMAKYEIPED